MLHVRFAEEARDERPPDGVPLGSVLQAEQYGQPGVVLKEFRGERIPPAVVAFLVALLQPLVQLEDPVLRVTEVGIVPPEALIDALHLLRSAHHRVVASVAKWGRWWHRIELSANTKDCGR